MQAVAHVQIFLSTVSAEFRSYRDALRRDLDRPNVTVKVQEDFIATGTETLDKLDEYIRQCHAVIHLVGDMTGALAQAPSVAAIRHRYPDLAGRLPVLGAFLDPGAPALSYTQWEAWLALYHDKMLIVATPQDGAPRDERYQLLEDQREAQQAHLARLETVGRYPEIRFANADRLAVDMLRSKLQDILALAGAVTKPSNLPHLSIGGLFKGRETLLGDLAGSLGPVPESGATAVVARLLNGMGGVGKTRLALEYALRRAGEYTALLFVSADGREALQRNLAALCKLLNLPEQGETDEGRQHDAVLGWLRQHPGWLLILDNIDSEEAAIAVEALLPQLLGGHALLTSRLANWSGSVAALPLDVLSPEAAADFLLARTDAKRRKQADDPAAARTLAEELGRLALALEQAGTYIAHRRLGFAHYLAEWQSQRDKVLAWFDPRVMQYPKAVAITWRSSFDQLRGPARRLLQRLAWLAPEPIPESLMEVPVPALDAAETDPFGALAELESYSLVARAADTPSFSVHRLVQEVTRRSQRDDGQRKWGRKFWNRVTRRSQRDDSAHATLTEALRWIDAAFVGDPQDVRDWPVLDPLAPHARAVTAHADAAEIRRAHRSADESSRLAALGEGPARRGRAADAPGAGHRRGELRAGPPQRRHRPQQPGRAAPGHEPPGGGRAADAPRAGHRRGELRAEAPQRRHRPQQPGRAAPGHQPPGGGRAADAPGAGHRRGELRAGPPQRRQPPQQPGRVAPGHEPPGRGRAADAPGTGHRRGELRAGSPQRRHPPQQPGPVAPGHATAWRRPSR